jgi:hypothetical protein
VDIERDFDGGPRRDPRANLSAGEPLSARIRVHVAADHAHARADAEGLILSRRLRRGRKEQHGADDC